MSVTITPGGRTARIVKSTEGFEVLMEVRMTKEGHELVASMSMEIDGKPMRAAICDRALSIEEALHAIRTEFTGQQRKEMADHLVAEIKQSVLSELLSTSHV